MEDNRRGYRPDIIDTSRERRMEGTLNRRHSKRLGIFTEDQLDPEYSYRWVNDELNRIPLMRAFCYDICGYDAVKGYVPTDTESESDGCIRMICGRLENGKPKYTYLMRKLRVWYDEDQAKIAAKRQALMDGIPEGNIPDAVGGGNTTGGNKVIQSNLDNFGGKRVRTGKVS